MPQMPPYVTVHIVYQERNMQVLMAENSLLEKVILLLCSRLYDWACMSRYRQPLQDPRCWSNLRKM